MSKDPSPMTTEGQRRPHGGQITTMSLFTFEFQLNSCLHMYCCYKNNNMLSMFSFIQGHALHPYEQERLQQCMANSARLRELGVSGFSSIFPNNSGTAVNKKNTKHRDNEDSGSEYDPSHNDTSEGDLIGDDNAKVLIPPPC